MADKGTMRYDACIECGETKTGRQRECSQCRSCAKSKVRGPQSLQHRANIGAGQKGNTNGSGTRSLTTRVNISIAKGGDGDLDNRKFPGIQRWTRLVKERDGHKCAECDFQGAKGDNFMDAHHVIPKAAYPELATVLFNGVTLCRPCHKQIHRENIEE